MLRHVGREGSAPVAHHSQASSSPIHGRCSCCVRIIILIATPTHSRSFPVAMDRGVSLIRLLEARARGRCLGGPASENGTNTRNLASRSQGWNAVVMDGAIEWSGSCNCRPFHVSMIALAQHVVLVCDYGVKLGMSLSFDPCCYLNWSAHRSPVTEKPDGSHRVSCLSIETEHAIFRSQYIVMKDDGIVLIVL